MHQGYVVKRVALAVAICVSLAGCATPHVVEERQVGDERLSCAQIEEQIADYRWGLR